eukprot:CAMPEP_0194117848 /NCGR_PEP_ID=MMETSP0150-20130528/33100_1 /TAXON_ID=122233 /ORGANISM="Chaetoceros debilis, Strain MM31A-1" /LENGTH=714 /DNA_ID=CAMNT_0038809021 /DNA_START=17 /DNA_END=2158 /DNA_ORIENTATION=+
MASILDKTVEEAFCSGELSILSSSVNSPDKPPNDTNGEYPTSSIVQEIESSSQDRTTGALNYSTSAYIRDGTSKRAKVVLPVLIKFINVIDRKKILKSDAIQPTPSDHDMSNDNSSTMDNIGGSDDGQVSGADVDEFDESSLWDAELAGIGETQDDRVEDIGHYELKFYCTCKDTTRTGGHELPVVESVKILSTSLVDAVCGIRFDVEITIQSVPQQYNKESSTKENDNSNLGLRNKLEVDLYKKTEASLSQLQLEIRSNLICTKNEQDPSKTSNSKRYGANKEKESNHQDPNSVGIDDIDLALQALDMASNFESPYEAGTKNTTASYFSRSVTYSLPDLSIPAPQLNLHIIPALVISVREISGASPNKGVTLVSLVIYHSNLHNENVTITNIGLHPGHSRIHSIDDFSHVSLVGDGKAIPGGEHAVVNMTGKVRWGYTSGTAPSMPLLLKPQEAFATVIQINANEVMMERAFVSPIVVRAVVGDIPEDYNIAANSVSDTFRDKEGRSTSMVIASADARWTTSPYAKGLTDAFKVTCTLKDSVCNVGSQVVVSLKVLNLSSEARDLMLIMAKDDEKGTDEFGSEDNRNLNGMSFAGGNVKSMTGTSTLGMSGASAMAASSQQTSSHSHSSVNNAVVYEVSGYTFGCWGLAGDDNGTVRYTRDHDLLAIDAALLLGEVKGQHFIDAELRFVPLREGTLSVPNLKLYDKIDGKWYD